MSVSLAKCVGRELLCSVLCCPLPLFVPPELWFVSEFKDIFPVYSRKINVYNSFKCPVPESNDNSFLKGSASGEKM